MNTNARHRISLTRLEIAKLIELASTEQPLSTESIHLLSKLNVFISKIDNKAIAAAYIPAARKDTLEALGEIPAGKSKEQVWEECYTKYIADPTSCNAVELECAMEHRYLNDLMTPEEIVAFEAAEFKKFN